MMRIKFWQNPFVILEPPNYLASRIHSTWRSSVRKRNDFALKRAETPQQSFMELIRCLDLRGVPQVRELDELGVGDALGGRAAQLGIVSRLLRKIRGW